MPMRKITIHACTLGVMLTSCLLANANAASWNGSYVAEGECFCSGLQGRDIDSRIIPTPVGGQSVSQICDRIGAGPTLQKVNGKFNFPVYQDAQCGHGPFSSNSAGIDEQCAGHLGVAGEDCAGPGPRWAITKAYAKPAVSEPGIKEASELGGGSRYIQPPTTPSVSAAHIVPDSKAESAASKSVADVKPIKKKPRKIVKAAPLTKEQIRARQLVQIEAARERARVREDQALNATLANSEPTIIATESDSEDLEILLTEEQKALNAEAAEEKLAEQSLTTSVESAAQVVDADSDTAATAQSDLPVTVSALKLPASTRNSASEFDYIEGLPVSYDFGGAGMRVAASISNPANMQYLMRASVAETYQEAFVGIGFFLNPKSADRLTLLLNTGIEYGKFEFQGAGVGANLSESGLYLGLSSRFVVNNRFELQAGVGYSSFFEGDAIVFGSAFYHLTPHLDLTTKAEAGDNDSLGFGIRYYY